jgi:hypothetical protein
MLMEPAATVILPAGVAPTAVVLSEPPLDSVKVPEASVEVPVSPISAAPPPTAITRTSPA